MARTPRKVVNNLQNSPVVDGFVDIETESRPRNNSRYNYSSEQNFTEAAAGIRALLQQIERVYPTNTTLERQVMVTEAINRIESNPKLKARMAAALESSSTEAFKQAVNHPLVNILMAALEGWQLD